MDLVLSWPNFAWCSLIGPHEGAAVSVGDWPMVDAGKQTQDLFALMQLKQTGQVAPFAPVSTKPGPARIIQPPWLRQTNRPYVYL